MKKCRACGKEYPDHKAPVICDVPGCEGQVLADHGFYAGKSPETTKDQGTTVDKAVHGHTPPTITEITGNQDDH